MADRSWPESSRHLGSQGRPCANAGPFKMTAAHSAMVPLATTQRQRHSIRRLRQVSTSRSRTPGLTLAAKQCRPCHRAWPTPMASQRVLPTLHVGVFRDGNQAAVPAEINGCLMPSSTIHTRAAGRTSISATRRKVLAILVFIAIPAGTVPRRPPPRRRPRRSRKQTRPQQKIWLTCQSSSVSRRHHRRPDG